MPRRVRFDEHELNNHGWPWVQGANVSVARSAGDTDTMKGRRSSMIHSMTWFVSNEDAGFIRFAMIYIYAKQRFTSKG